MPPIRTVKTVCSHDCPDACSVLVEVEADETGVERAARFRGDPAHPFTRGFLCGKVQHYERVVHSGDRLLHPLKRSGPKGSGEFERVSWAAALRDIAERFLEIRDRHGGEAIFPYSYAGTMGLVHRNAYDAIFHRLGASRQRPNICYYGADAGYAATVGSGYGVDPEDAAHSDLILVWGQNVVTTQVHLIPFFDEARKRGAKMLVIDPYKNRTGRAADEWISVEPGTDAALALGLLHILKRDRKLDHKFIAERTLGWDRFASEVLPKWTPAKAARVSQVSEAKIEELARTLGAAKAPLFKVGIGIGRSSQGGQAVRAICALAGALGSYRHRGGGVVYDTGCEHRFDLRPVTRPDWLEGDPRTINQTDLGPLLAGTLTGHEDRPVHALLVHSANPLATAPRQELVRQGLLREDLFTVVHERFLTDTARFADYVLPAVTFAEASDLYKSYGHLHAQFGARALTPLGEALPNLEVAQALGRALGFEGAWFEKTVEDFAREILIATDHPNFEGLDVERFLEGETFRLNVPRGESGFRERFATPSGKLEFYSVALEREGKPPLPDWAGDPFATDLERYPLRLVTPPAHAFLNSSFGSLEDSVLKERSAPRVLIHPRDAGEIQSGDPVRLANEYGQVELLAEVSEDTRPGTVIAEGTWWPSQGRDGRGINALCSERLTDLGGGSTFHDNRVVLRPARPSQELPGSGQRSQGLPGSGQRSENIDTATS